MSRPKEMMMRKKILCLLPAIILLLAACMPSQEQIDQIVLSVEQTAIAQVTVIAPTADVEAIVQATFQALTAQAPILPSATALPTDVPATQGATDNIPTNTPPGGLVGSIAGALGYPAESIPAMAVIAFHVGGGPTDYYYVLTAAGQNSYQLDNLPPGQYTVMAYTMGGGAFPVGFGRSEEHTSELQSRLHLVCRLLLEKKKNTSGEHPDWPQSTALLAYRLDGASA